MEVIKKTLYPKTERIKDEEAVVHITEKLDGANIGFFKLNDKLIIAQRNNILVWEPEVDYQETLKQLGYKGLENFLKEHGKELLETLHEGSGFFGEWIGMGKIKYQDNFPKRVYIFAKANIYLNDSNNYAIKNLCYTHELFKYPFSNQEIPDYLGTVPTVAILDKLPSVEELNNLYTKYIELVKRDVEGFVINYRNTVSKYVRHKNGKLTEHKS